MALFDLLSLKSIFTNYGSNSSRVGYHLLLDIPNPEPGGPTPVPQDPSPFITSTTPPPFILTTPIIQTTTSPNLVYNLSQTPIPNITDISNPHQNQTTTSPYPVYNLSQTPIPNITDISNPHQNQTTTSLTGILLTTPSPLSNSSKNQTPNPNNQNFTNNISQTTSFYTTELQQTTAFASIPNTTPFPLKSVSSGILLSTPSPFNLNNNQTNSKNYSTADFTTTPAVIKIGTPPPKILDGSNRSQTILLATAIPGSLVIIATLLVLYLKKIKQAKAVAKNKDIPDIILSKRGVPGLARRASEKLSAVISFSRRSEADPIETSNTKVVQNKTNFNKRNSAPDILGSTNSNYSSNTKHLRRNTFSAMTDKSDALINISDTKSQHFPFRFPNNFRSSLKQSPKRSPKKLYNKPPQLETDGINPSNLEEKNLEFRQTLPHEFLPSELKRVSSIVPEGFIRSDLLREIIIESYNLYYNEQDLGRAKDSLTKDLTSTKNLPVKKLEIFNTLRFLITRREEKNIDDLDSYYKENPLKIDEFASMIIETRICSSVYKWLQGKHKNWPELKKIIYEEMKPHMTKVVELSRRGALDRDPSIVKVPDEEPDNSKNRIISGDLFQESAPSTTDIGAGGVFGGNDSSEVVITMQNSPRIRSVSELQINSHSFVNQSSASSLNLHHSQDNENIKSKDSQEGRKPSDNKEDISVKSNKSNIESTNFLASAISNNQQYRNDQDSSKPSTITCRQRVSQCVGVIKSCSIS